MAHASSSWRRLTVFATLLVAGLLFLSGCAGGSGFKWVGHADSRAYFKVPANWTAYQKDHLLTQAGQADSIQANQAFKWLIGFDSSPSPSPENVLSGIADYPVVLAEVRQLDENEQDVLSRQAIRNAVYPVDEMVEKRQVEVLSYEDVVLKDGIHGNRIVFNLSTQGVYNLVPGNAVLRVQQIGLVDPATGLLYVLLVRCQADCYSANERLIDQIADSWTVKER